MEVLVQYVDLVLYFFESRPSLYYRFCGLVWVGLRALVFAFKAFWLFFCDCVVLLYTPCIS